MKKFKFNFLFSIFTYLVAILILSLPVKGTSFVPKIIFFGDPQINKEEKTVKIDLNISTLNYEINAITASFNYSKDILKLVEIDTSDSVFENIVEKDIGQEGHGEISMYSDMSKGGFFNGNGKIAQLKFLILKNEDAKIELDKNSGAFEKIESKNTIESYDSIEIKLKEEMKVGGFKIEKVLPFVIVFISVFFIVILIIIFKKFIRIDKRVKLIILLAFIIAVLGVSSYSVIYKDIFGLRRKASEEEVNYRICSMIGCCGSDAMCREGNGEALFNLLNEINGISDDVSNKKYVITLDYVRYKNTRSDGSYLSSKCSNDNSGQEYSTFLKIASGKKVKIIGTNSPYAPAPGTKIISDGSTMSGICIENNASLELINVEISGFKYSNENNNDGNGIFALGSSKLSVLSCKISKNRNGIFAKGQSELNISKLNLIENEVAGLNLTDDSRLVSGEEINSIKNMYGIQISLGAIAKISKSSFNENLSTGLLINNMVQTKENGEPVNEGDIKETYVELTEITASKNKNYGMKVGGFSGVKIKNSSFNESRSENENNNVYESGIVMKDRARVDLESVTLSKNKTGIDVDVADNNNLPEKPKLTIRGNSLISENILGLSLRKDAEGDISNLIVSDNQAQGIFIRDNAKVRMTSSRVFQNLLEGIVYQSSNSSEFIGLKIYSNGYAGILTDNNGKFVLKNSIIAINAKEGLIIQNKIAKIVNNSIYWNNILQDSNRAGGIFIGGGLVNTDANDKLSVRNNVISANVSWGIKSEKDYGEFIDYNNIYGNGRATINGIVYSTPTGNYTGITLKPEKNNIISACFGENDFNIGPKLKAGSKCIDSGHPTLSNVNYSDPDKSRNDIGAYGGPDACLLDSTVSGCSGCQNASCVNKQCGSDGCTSFCGSNKGLCPEGYLCSANNICYSANLCAGKECSPDGQCGSCSEGKVCENFKCVEPCNDVDCVNKECGWGVGKNPLNNTACLRWCGINCGIGKSCLKNKCENRECINTNIKKDGNQRFLTYTDDLSLLLSNWKKGYGNIADIDRDANAKYGVYTRDLSMLLSCWKYEVLEIFDIGSPPMP